MRQIQSEERIAGRFIHPPFPPAYRRLVAAIRTGRIVRCGVAVACALVAGWGLAADDPPGDTAWPAVTAECRPWTRWWWLGSAVDEPNLRRELEAIAAAGFGGVEITPIYGAKGAEARFLKFLSPEYVAALGFTLSLIHI